MLLVGCSKTRIGKVELSDEKLPNFLKVGTTSAQEVLEQIGEPFGYREQENRSAMIFLDFQEDYVNLLITEIRLEKAYRLDLVFQDDILQKAEIKKEGWVWILNFYNCWPDKTLFFHFFKHQIVYE